MKGLLRNNYYNARGVLLGCLSSMVVCFVSVFIIYVYNPDFLHSYPIIFMALMGAFSSINITLMQNDGVSKWCNFELTTPIDKKDVIKSKYLFFIAMAIIAIVSMAINTISVDLLLGLDTLERAGYILMFTVAFFTLVPAITYPLVIKFGNDKVQTFYLIGVGVTMLLVMGSPLLFTNIMISNLVFRTSIITICIISFILSYFLTINLYYNELK